MTDLKHKIHGKEKIDGCRECGSVKRVVTKRQARSREPTIPAAVHNRFPTHSNLPSSCGKACMHFEIIVISYKRDPKKGPDISTPAPAPLRQITRSTLQNRVSAQPDPAKGKY